MVLKMSSPIVPNPPNLSSSAFASCIFEGSAAEGFGEQNLFNLKAAFDSGEV